MSRPGPNTEDLAQKCHGFVKLGEVRQGKARHKALLYKLICDALKLDCSIHRVSSQAGTHVERCFCVEHRKCRRRTAPNSTMGGVVDQPEGTGPVVVFKGGSFLSGGA